MKKQTYFRINLFDGADYVCEKVVFAAARSNGRKEKVTLDQLKGIVESKIAENPTLNDDIFAEVIGNHLLHIDRKFGEEYKTVCVIEEVEIMELEPTNEENGYGAMAE